MYRMDIGCRLFFHQGSCLKSQLDHLEAAIIDYHFNLAEQRCRFALQRDKLVYHKKCNTLGCQKALGTLEKFVSQVAIYAESLMKGWIA
jgi:hypothetical protein